MSCDQLFFFESVFRDFILCTFSYENSQLYIFIMKIKRTYNSEFFLLYLSKKSKWNYIYFMLISYKRVAVEKSFGTI